jgi:hypothetical protein
LLVVLVALVSFAGICGGGDFVAADKPYQINKVGAVVEVAVVAVKYRRAS